MLGLLGFLPALQTYFDSSFLDSVYTRGQSQIDRKGATVCVCVLQIRSLNIAVSVPWSYD